MAFYEKAEQRLKTEHPELARVLMEQRQAEQQKATPTSPVALPHSNPATPSRFGSWIG
jgi:hypothetical protein